MKEDRTKHFTGNFAQKAIIENSGKILVCRGVGDELWEFPGGRLHKDETPKEGLAREVLEELGIKVEVGVPLHMCRSFHNQTQDWQMIAGFACALDAEQDITLDPDELEEYKWITKEELKTLTMFDDCREIADVFLEK